VTGTRRVAVGMMLALLGLGIAVALPGSWSAVRYKTVYLEQPSFNGAGSGVVRGWVVLERWGPDRHRKEIRRRLWSVRTGMLEQELTKEGETLWDLDGTVRCQWPHVGDAVMEPPWLWGATDQLNKDAPWVLEGVDAEAWWLRHQP
jgi:hypothetical protein